jgi:hypothetical protein
MDLRGAITTIVDELRAADPAATIQLSALSCAAPGIATASSRCEFVEAGYRRQELVAIAQMVLAELARGVTVMTVGLAPRARADDEDVVGAGCGRNGRIGENFVSGSFAS